MKWPSSGRFGRNLLVLLVGFMMVFSTVAYVVTNPRPGQEYYRFYVLGMSGSASDYFSGNSTISVGHGANWTVGVTDSTGLPQLVEVVVKLGNSTTVAPNDSMNTPSNGVVAATYLQALLDNQTWRFPLSWKLSNVVTTGTSTLFTVDIAGRGTNASVTAAGGKNLRLIIELWTYDSSSGGLAYGWLSGDQRMSAWLQVWFDVSNS